MLTSLRNIMAALTCLIALCGPLTFGQANSEKQLRSRAQLFSSQVPISFAEKLVVTDSGRAYLLDTDLSSLFVIDNKDGRLQRMCGSDSLSSPSDISIDNHGNVWVLSGLHSKIVKLTPQCQRQFEIVSKHMPLRVAATALGELIVLNGAGQHLFELYGPDGRFLRNFGQRL